MGEEKVGKFQEVWRWACAKARLGRPLKIFKAKETNNSNEIPIDHFEC